MWLSQLVWAQQPKLNVQSYYGTRDDKNSECFLFPNLFNLSNKSVLSIYRAIYGCLSCCLYLFAFYHSICLLKRWSLELPRWFELLFPTKFVSGGFVFLSGSNIQSILWLIISFKIFPFCSFLLFYHLLPSPLNIRC